MEHARNTLTQRTMLPGCVSEVTVSSEDLRPGDVAGLCFLIGSWGLIGVARERDGTFLVMKARDPGASHERERARVPWAGGEVRLRAVVRFEGMTGRARFCYESGGGFLPLGPEHEMTFALDHFTGCRVGLFLYATRETGGAAAFSRFTLRPVDVSRVR